ncbi:DNA ligase 4 isoform X2 [Canna indica]|uniref:DNA ligase n=1 Tax=Canna indica TaxID=4628 RepID=A0AAQ3JV54_9LILI|nr:DNA ligase 4 isoform X2 [Canna indica]
MTDTTVRFGLLVSMFQAMLRDRTAAKKRKRFRTFLDRVYTGREYFSAVRLILPGLDRERGTYGLKESTLATCLVEALGLAKDSPDAIRLVNWRKGGSRSGANAGNFALVSAEVLQRRQGMVSGGLTIRELNDMLDQLATKENRGEKAAVLSSLIKKTNALEMKWIVMIILKDLKLGLSEKSIFHEFHPDAEDLFNVTCDLKLVCEKLKDHTQRQKKQDIEVGKPVRPQLAMRVSDATTAWKKLSGKNVVVECKFDGDRIQIHKNGEEIHFFSRNFLDHAEYAHGMSNLIQQNVLVERCILDGEMLVWDTCAQCFADFGSNQEIAKAAREGLESDRQVKRYVVFDILYVGDTSVIHQSLMERHSLMRKVVKPLKGRLEILVPNGGINDHRPSGEPCWSAVAYSVEEVERFFKDTIENRDEGIVVKDLGSKWEPSDRSGKWMKLKPDYIHAASDLDVLIIGGYFGSGRRGGEVSQFLLGLADHSDPASYPKRFISFCRVGSGLSDEELNALVAKLNPYFRKNEYPKRAPRCYEVTNNSKERPDVWIESPDKSVILSITSDIRTVKSEVFAAPYSLRFPRISRVRYDKPWHECLDVQSFVELVQSSNGNTWRTEHGGMQSQNPKRMRTTKRGERKNVSMVPAHFIHTDISDVKGETFIFANMVFYFVNIPPCFTMDYFHKMVVENGGTFSMNLNDSVTHCIASEKKGIRYQAAVRHGDIIHYSWILDCCKQKSLLLLQPKYFLHFAGTSKRQFPDQIDAFADYYYWDIDVADIKQIFSNMVGLGEDFNRIEYYKKKYCPLESFCFFRGCCIYIFEAMPIINMNCKVISELALRRMRLEITMHAGEVCDDLMHATHLLVYSMNDNYNFDKLYKSFPPEQRRLLHSNNLHIVRYQWLEDSVKEAKKLHEDVYNLKPDSFEVLQIDKGEHSPKLPPTSKMENTTVSTPFDKSETRKRTRPSQRNTKKAKSRPAKRTRGRVGHRPAKIERDESVSSDSSVEKSQEAPESRKYSPMEDEDAEPSESIGSKLVCNHSGFHGIDAAQLHDKEDIEQSKFQQRLDCNQVLEDDSGQGEKLEQMVDPLHAMLLDMVPSLSQRKVEGESSISEGVKPAPRNADANPVKKKVLPGGMLQQRIEDNVNVVENNVLSD